MPDLEALTLDRLRLSAAVRAPRTLAAYAMDWRHFTAWMAAHDLPCLPASTDGLAHFVCDELNRGRRVTTVTRHVTSIVYAHRAAGFPSPCADGEIALLLLGAKRIRCEQPVQKEPISVADLQRICLAPSVGLTATRNVAILLFAFATALRRSNIAAVDLEDLRFTARGFVVHIGKSKTDQAGVGFDLAVPTGQYETCPVKAMRAWLEFRGDSRGPLFQPIHNRRIETGKRLHPNRISLVIKAQMESLGFPAAIFGAHSARSGHVTEALANGVDHLVIMRTTRHRSVASLRRYERERDPFRSNSCAGLGL
jgi:integrase